MNIKAIYAFVAKNQLPSFRAKQIINALIQGTASRFEDISTLPKDLRQKLASELKFLSFECLATQISTDKLSFKALLGLSDGSKIETVLLAPKPGSWAVCVSSQVGCALGCRFCATGQLGFKRNLTAEEITDQILFWRQFAENNPAFGIRDSSFSVIFMGMGEPFLNYTNVKAAIKDLIDPDIFSIGARHISVSTSGLPPGIKQFAQDFPQVNLAISLVAPTDQQRSELMPINRKFNLSAIKKAVDYYLQANNRKVFFEYILFASVNDRRQDAENLVALVKSLQRPELIHVNLIRYNVTSQGFKPSDRPQSEWFKNFLLKNKVSATIRKSLGEEIQGACGQLAGK